MLLVPKAHLAPPSPNRFRCLYLRQVVTLSVYLYFVLTLFSQQFLLKRDGIAGKDVDLIIPVAAVLQFFFFMGWLKV